MKGIRLKYTLAFLLVTAVVAGGGALLFGPGQIKGVLVGAGSAFVIQFAVLQLLLLRACQRNVLVGHGVGMLLRFGSVGLMAFLVIPALALPAAATLLSMVGCFFLTTLIEAVLPKRRQEAAQAAGVTTIQTEL